MKDFRDLYSASFKEHGPTAQGVGWLDEEVQQRRFWMLINDIQFNVSSMLDVGCGYGELVRFLNRHRRQWFSRIQYTGIDMVPEMIEVARTRYQWAGSNATLNTREFHEVDIRDWVSEDRHPGNDIETYDLVLCSGALTFHTMPEKLTMLDAMWTLTNRILAFNVVTKKDTSGNMGVKTYHLDMLLSRFDTDNWMVRHDYGLDDMTIVVRR